MHGNWDIRNFAPHFYESRYNYIMRNLLIVSIALASFALIGCGPTEPEGKIDAPATGAGTDPATNNAPATGTESTSNTGGGAGGSVQIHGSGAGGVAPVTGTEGLGGGGGGVQQAAKEKALGAAASAGAGSAGQMGNEEGGE